MDLSTGLLTPHLLPQGATRPPLGEAGMWVDGPGAAACVGPSR